MRLEKLVAAVSALAIPAVAHAEQSGPQPAVPKPTKADAQKVVQIITSDKVAQNSAADADTDEDFSIITEPFLEDQPVISMASKKCLGCSNCLINVVWTSSTSGDRRRAYSCERSSDFLQRFRQAPDAPLRYPLE